MKQLSRRIFYALIALVFFFFPTIAKSKSTEKKEISNEVAVKWAKVTLEFINGQPNKTPTFISRTLAYIGITMYESVMNSNKKYQSITSELNGLSDLPKPELGKVYDWEVVLNTSQSKIIRELWQPLKFEYGKYSVEKLDSLESAILSQRKSIVADAGIINRSIAYGNSLAEAIYLWSSTDGGHDFNYKNFDPTYTYPKGINFWEPPVGEEGSRQ